MKNETNVNLNYVILGLLVVLVVFSGAQAIQIDKLQNNVQSVSGAEVISAPAPVKTTSSAPVMVGGC